MPLLPVFQALIGPDGSRDSGKACRRSLKTSSEPQLVQAVPDEPDRIVFVRPLPGDALIEFVVRCRLSWRVELALVSIGDLPQRWAAGWRDRRQ